MIKILCLIDTLGMGGGAERQMAGLAGLLHRKGYDVTVTSYHEHDSDEFIEKKYGIRSVLINTNDNPFSKLLAVRKFVQNNHFDTLIAYKDGAAMLACLVKMLGGKFKLIVSERNTTQVLNKHERIKFFLYRWADIIVPNAVSQSNFIKGNYPNLYHKVSVITNFTDINYFKPSEHNKPDDSVLSILVIARFSSQKNILGFMNVVKKMKVQGAKIHVNWYGSVYHGQEEYGKKCEEQYRRLNLSDMMTFHGATSNILQEYQKCDIFCLPSFYEGFPNVVCEAMSCGKPILCSNVCDNPYLVQDGVNGFLFNPLDEDDMVKKINKIISLSQEEREKMGRKSREIAEVLFSEEMFVKKYIELIEG